MFGIAKRSFPDGGSIKMNDGEVMPFPKRWNEADKETYKNALIIWPHYGDGGGVSITTPHDGMGYFIRFGDSKDPSGPVSDEELAELPLNVAAAYRYWRGRG